MKKILHAVILLATIFEIRAQTNPVITTWMQTAANTPMVNPSYPALECNVQSVYYTNPPASGRAYVSASSVPGYAIGPWAGNPNSPSDQNFIGSYPLAPAEQTGTKTNTGLGAIGFWKNGVAIFNAKDGHYWNNTTMTMVNGITFTGWNRNAYYWEGSGFDACKGHPNQPGAYHHHISPSCLYDQNASTQHSPLIGFGWDGFPIYGTFGYTNVDGTGGIKRITTSYVLSTASTRTNGPPVNATYPLGSMCEDYVFTSGTGDLDLYHGRFCVTPEYPNGTYCYFATLLSTGIPSYPFVMAAKYYGIVTSTSTNQTIPGGAIQYIQAPLPVEIFSFTVQLDGNDAQIAWQVGEAANFSHFEIERSEDALHFQKIGYAKASGQPEYRFTDAGLKSGNHYYRLRSVDLNGSAEYSPVVSVHLSGGKTLMVHNNPASDFITVQHNDAFEERTVRLIDASGRTVLESVLPPGTTMKTFDVQTFYDGFYWLTVSDGRQSSSSVVVISH